VLLDVAGAGNIQLSRPLRELLPSVKIVAFAVADREELIIACAEAGISGYVPRTASLEDVVAAVHATIRGELYCSPRTAGLLFSQMALRPRKRAPAAVLYVLTQREKEILALVEQGFSNKEIGRSLRIGHATVKNHVHSILSKLQVRRRGEAAAWVRQANIDHYGRDRSSSPSASAAASLHGLDHRN
jgi:DNA-binding NarL/FixJ family response regulator